MQIKGEEQTIDFCCLKRRPIIKVRKIQNISNILGWKLFAVILGGNLEKLQNAVES